MSPHCNRCFGFLASALENKYIAIPQVTAFYHLKYNMDSEKAEIVAEAVKEELRSLGFGDWIDADERSDNAEKDEL